MTRHIVLQLNTMIHKSSFCCWLRPGQIYIFYWFSIYYYIVNGVFTAFVCFDGQQRWYNWMEYNIFFCFVLVISCVCSLFFMLYFQIELFPFFFAFLHVVPYMIESHRNWFESISEIPMLTKSTWTKKGNNNRYDA